MALLLKLEHNVHSVKQVYLYFLGIACILVGMRKEARKADLIQHTVKQETHNLRKK